jgi:hypothetical protein
VYTEGKSRVAQNKKSIIKGLRSFLGKNTLYTYNFFAGFGIKMQTIAKRENALTINLVLCISSVPKDESGIFLLKTLDVMVFIL